MPFDSLRYEHGDHGATGATGLSTPPSVVLKFALPPNVDRAIPVGSVDIDDLVARYERDPRIKDLLIAARRGVAPLFETNARHALRALRLNKGLSQSNVAARMASTQSHVARIESGAQDVQVGTLVRYANAIGVEPKVIVEAFLAISSA